MERRGGCLLRAVALGMLAGCVGVWYVVVPPVGGVQIPPGPVSTPVPDAQNAAVEYRKATEALGPVPKYDPDHRPKEDPLEDPWRWMSGRRPTPTELAGFDKRNEAFGHLKRGAARHRFRRLATVGGERPLGEVSPDDNEQLLVRQLAMRACCAALVRDGAGHPSNDLALAAYKLGADWGSDPDTAIIPSMIGDACRSIAAATLFRLLGSPHVTAGDCLKIAVEVQAAATLPLRPDLVFESDFRHSDAQMQKYYDDEPGPMRGFAERSFLGVQREQRRWLDSHRAALAAYDVPAWEKACDEYRAYPKGWTDWRWLVGHPLPHQMVGGLMTSILDANIRHILPMLAVDRANASGLVAVACLQAYRLHHGSYPTQLAPAFAEVGLPTPTMGYRIDADGPLVWLPGVDGVDDGGRRPYARDDAQNPTLQGHDLVFRPGRVPLHLTS